MTYFPQPNPAKRARRVKLPGSVAVAIRSEGGQPVRAKLHQLSATGGLLLLPKALEQGDFVEVAFQTSQGIVRGMAELLAARAESKSGCLQPFRFVALGDEDHTKLRMALQSLMDQTIIGSAPANVSRSS
ncbi:MAG TPA: PilZ domain-containing protein [Terriglobales bacterium]|jgi:c-di-GMP-binding flagellar brake protein YcgR|nr:PilZ domain-containing protein [Terriglobales bacterium]